MSLIFHCFLVSWVGSPSFWCPSRLSCPLSCPIPLHLPPRKPILHAEFVTCLLSISPSEGFRVPGVAPCPTDPSSQCQEGSRSRQAAGQTATWLAAGLRLQLLWRQIGKTSHSSSAPLGVTPAVLSGQWADLTTPSSLVLP